MCITTKGKALTLLQFYEEENGYLTEAEQGKPISVESCSSVRTGQTQLMVGKLFQELI